MTKEVMISLLHYAATGNDLLAVLDTLTDDMVSDNQPTTESIEF